MSDVLGRESSLRTKELFNLVLKARQLGGSAFCSFIGWKCLCRHWVGFP